MASRLTISVRTTVSPAPLLPQGEPHVVRKGAELTLGITLEGSAPQAAPLELTAELIRDDDQPVPSTPDATTPLGSVTTYVLHPGSSTATLRPRINVLSSAFTGVDMPFRIRVRAEDPSIEPAVSARIVVRSKWPAKSKRDSSGAKGTENAPATLAVAPTSNVASTTASVTSVPTGTGHMSHSVVATGSSTVAATLPQSGGSGVRPTVIPQVQRGVGGTQPAAAPRAQVAPPPATALGAHGGFVRPTAGGGAPHFPMKQQQEVLTPAAVAAGSHLQPAALGSYMAALGALHELKSPSPSTSHVTETQAAAGGTADTRANALNADDGQSTDMVMNLKEIGDMLATAQPFPVPTGADKLPAVPEPLHSELEPDELEVMLNKFIGETDLEDALLAFEGSDAAEAFRAAPRFEPINPEDLMLALEQPVEESPSPSTLDALMVPSADPTTMRTTDGSTTTSNAAPSRSRSRSNSTDDSKDDTHKEGDVCVGRRYRDASEVDDEGFDKGEQCSLNYAMEEARRKRRPLVNKKSIRPSNVPTASLPAWLQRASLCRNSGYLCLDCVVAEPEPMSMRLIRGHGKADGPLFKVRWCSSNMDPTLGVDLARLVHGSELGAIFSAECHEALTRASTELAHSEARNALDCGMLNLVVRDLDEGEGSEPQVRAQCHVMMHTDGCPNGSICVRRYLLLAKVVKHATRGADFEETIPRSECDVPQEDGDVVKRVRAGRVVYSSPNTYTLSGYHAWEFLGREAGCSVHPDDAQRWYTQKLEVARKLEVNPKEWVKNFFTYRHVHRECGWVWVYSQVETQAPPARCEESSSTSAGCTSRSQHQLLIESLQHVLVRMRAVDQPGQNTA